MTPNSTCPICGARPLTFAFQLSRGPVFECSACGVFVAEDRSVDAEQDRQFHQSLDETLYVEYFEPFRKKQYRDVLGRAGVQRGHSLLDVGASYGWMVDVGLQLGLDSYGIEPSPMDHDESLAGRIACQTLDEHAALATRRYDVITMWHVLEHLRDPVTAASKIGGLLSDNGIVVIAVPNAEGRMYGFASRLTKTLRYRRLMEELWYTHNPNMHRTYPTS